MANKKIPIGLDGRTCRYFKKESHTCSSSDNPCSQTAGEFGCIVEIELNRLDRHQPSPGGTAMFRPGLGAYIF